MGGVGMTVDDFMDTGFDAMMEAVSEDDEKAEVFPDAFINTR